MAAQRSPSIVAKPRVPKSGESDRISHGRDNWIEDFFWNVISINSDFEAISFAWSQLLGVTIHQWMILSAIRDLDGGDGVSVKLVSAKLRADASVVTTQSKSLEKSGFLRRKPSAEDGRVVLMSLTEKASREIANLRSAQDATKEAMFAELNDRELRDLNEKLSLLRERVQRAAKRLAAEL